MPQQPGRISRRASAGKTGRGANSRPNTGRDESVVQTVDSPITTTTWPLRIRAPRPQAGTADFEPFASASSASDRSARRSRVLPPIAPPPRTPGIRFHVEQALVRDVTKPRSCPTPGRITCNPVRLPARHLRRRHRGARHRRTGAHAGCAPAWARHVGGHGQQGAGGRARRASRIDRRVARRGVSVRSHRAVGRAVSRHARRSPSCRIRRSRPGDRQRHVQLPADVARGVRQRRSIRRWPPRRNSGMRSPIRRAISTASMPPTNCCCSRRSLDGDGCRAKRSTSAAFAA